MSLTQPGPAAAGPPVPAAQFTRPGTAYRTAGIAGLASVVLTFGGQALIAVGGSEPAFDAPADAVADYFAGRDQTLFALGSALSVLAVVVFLWFLGGLYALLRDDWRTIVAVLSAVLGMAPVLSSGWQLAVFRQADGVDPQISRLAFDLGNLSFASGWVALGGFAIATGWAVLASRALPRWLGWWALTAGACLVAARFVWTTPNWLIGYFLLWVWVIAVSLMFLRTAATGTGRRNSTTGPWKIRAEIRAPVSSCS
jgi:hypothetical protein